MTPFVTKLHSNHAIVLTCHEIEMPFSSLPDDALLYLFTIVVNDYAQAALKDGACYGLKPALPIAMTLSQIASFVRPLVRSAPLLWTVIDDVVLQNPSFLYLHLDNSRQCLLDILAVTWEDGKFPLFMPLLAYVDRWRLLHLTTSSIEDYRLIATSFTNLRLPKLQELHISCHDDGEPSDDVMTRVFRGGTPSLKQLHICNVACFPSSLATVTHLRIHNMALYSPLLSYSAFVQVLATMRSLRYISLIGEIVYITEPIVAETVNLPDLRSLKLITEEDDDEFMEYEEEGNCYNAVLLALFTSTVLKRLYLLQPACSTLEPILDDMRCKRLRFLHITELYWGIEIEDRDDALTFIQSFPAVENLVFADINGAVIIEAPADSPNGRDLWRNMCTIEFGAHDIPLARRLIESRINVRRPLRRVQLRKPMSKGHALDLKWMRERVRVVLVSRRDYFNGVE